MKQLPYVILPLQIQKICFQFESYTILLHLPEGRRHLPEASQRLSVSVSKCSSKTESIPGLWEKVSRWMKQALMHKSLGVYFFLLCFLDPDASILGTEKLVS